MRGSMRERRPGVWELIVQLPHFSRYVVGGKAGWKQTPQRDDD